MNDAQINCALRPDCKIAMPSQHSAYIRRMMTKAAPITNQRSGLSLVGSAESVISLQNQASPPARY
jgi:hypothetical protein